MNALRIIRQSENLQPYTEKWMTGAIRKTINESQRLHKTGMLLGALAYSRRADLPFWGPNPEARIVKALLSIFDKEALVVCQAYCFYPAFPTLAGHRVLKGPQKEEREKI